MAPPITRDVAHRGVRRKSIARCTIGTPMMFGMPQEVQDALAASVPFRSRWGTSADGAKLVQHVVEHNMLDGKAIRLSPK